MATPTPCVVSSSPNTSAQGSPRRDWNSLRAGEPGSAFRGIGRGRGSRGSGIKGGRAGAPSHPGQRGSSQSDTTNSSPSPSSKVSPVSRKPPVPIPAAPTSNGSERAMNISAERGGRPKLGSRRQSQAVPAVVVAPASPSQTSQTVSSPRSATRRRRPLPGKSSTTTTKPPPVISKAQTSRGGSTPTYQPTTRKDVLPHLAAAHQAEIRHDIDALVERVRAVAMADNRPTTPGSHIDWAGDEDDSLPDLDDWGVTTTHTDTTPYEAQNEEISPILADTLKPLPEPNSEVQEEHEQEMETYEAQPEPAKESFIEPSSMHSTMEGEPALPPTADGTPEQGIAATVSDDSSSFPLSDEKPPLHPSLPPKPVAAMESLRTRSKSVSKPSSLPPKPPVAVMEETPTTKTDGLYESMHAPSADERVSLESVSSTSSGERGLTGSIHAPVPGLPESQSAPSLSECISSAVQHTHSHSRSHTESRPGIHQPHTAPPSTVSHRHGRSGAASPLGKHVYTHSRNHSTPVGSASSRLPQSSRPVITGEAISRLARTIGGIGPTRAQSIPVTKDSTISS